MTFFRELTAFFTLLVRDLLLLFLPPPKPFRTLSLSEEGLQRFPFPQEIEPILAIASDFFGAPETYPVNPYALLLAIRAAERGRPGFEFGIVAAKDTDLKTQCEYACRTIQNTFERFQRENQKSDFIAFLGARYAPRGAENDPTNLNQYWVKNVRYFYGVFSASKAPC
ncbi:MAG: hypothetical protein N2509_06450 [Treponemataceae bacterium]|nr:hypothetical protein [Treponemataceae bacterium]